MSGRWGKGVVVLTAVLLLAVVNTDIYRKERLLADGQTVLLTLAPVDPRAIIQGDYMRLRYALEREAFSKAGTQTPNDGYLVLALDENRVASLRRLADDSPLADDEILLRYRIRNGRAKIASDAFFFQEGEARRYQGARYGELRVAADGEALLAALRDKDFKRLAAATP